MRLPSSPYKITGCLSPGPGTKLRLWVGMLPQPVQLKFKRRSHCTGGSPPVPPWSSAGSSMHLQPTRSGSDCFAGFAGANKIHAAVLGEEQPLFPALVMPAKAECLVESPALAGTTIGSMGPGSLYTCQVARASYLVFQSWRNSTAGCKRTRIREEFPKPGCFALQSGRAFLLALCIASWVRRLQPVTCWQ